MMALQFFYSRTMKLGILAVLLLNTFVMPMSAHASPQAYKDTSYELNPNPVLGQAFHFSANAQATYRVKGTNKTAVDPNYVDNVKTFWGFVSPAGRNLAAWQATDPNNFEGILALPPGTQLNSEPVFGPYNSYQGMKKIFGGTGIVGGGACNTNGMLAMVLWYAGFRVRGTCVGHPAQIGVESRFWVTVQSGSGCTVYATSMSQETLYLHWKISGDDIALWVDNNSNASNGTVPPSASVSGAPSNAAPAGSSGSTAGSTASSQPKLSDIPIYGVDMEMLMSDDSSLPPVGSDEVSQPLMPDNGNPSAANTTGPVTSTGSTSVIKPKLPYKLPFGIVVGGQAYYPKTEAAIEIVVILVALPLIILLYFGFKRR